MQPLLVVLISLVLAYLLSEFLRYMKIPRVVGQIGAGLIMGIPIIKGWLFTEQLFSIFEFLGSMGMVLLFFFVGLEINIRGFKENLREMAMISLLNTMIPFSIGFLVSYYIFNINLPASIVVAIALSVSSEAISVDMLEEFRMLKSKVGTLIVHSGTVDDIFELILITGVLSLIHATTTPYGLLQLFMDMVIFLIFVVLFRFIIIPFIIHRIEKEKTQTALFGGALIVTLLIASLSEFLGLGSLLGALIAGILVGQILHTEEHKHHMDEKAISQAIHVFSFGFLVPIFFIWVGVNTDLGAIFANINLSLVLIIIAIVGTVGGTVLGVLLSRGTLKEGLIVGWGVNPKGDVDLVIATLALQSGLITKGIFSAIIFMAVVTTFLSPIVFRRLIMKHAEKHTSRDFIP